MMLSSDASSCISQWSREIQKTVQYEKNLPRDEKLKNVDFSLQGNHATTSTLVIALFFNFKALCMFSAEQPF